MMVGPTLILSSLVCEKMGREEVKVCEMSQMTILPIMLPFALPDPRLQIHEPELVPALLEVGLGWNVFENKPHAPEQLFGIVVASHWKCHSGNLEAQLDCAP